MYTKELKLQDNERPAKINQETGEVTEISVQDHMKTVKNMNLIEFKHEAIFQKTYIKAWELLRTQTTKQEFEIATLLALRAKPFTNSLDPLNDDTTAESLAQEFKVSRNTVKNMFTKLFELGVFGKFELYEQYKNFKKYWIFNPYLSFNGKGIDKSIPGLFDNTTYKIIALS